MAIEATCLVIRRIARHTSLSLTLLSAGAAGFVATRASAQYAPSSTTTTDQSGALSTVPPATTGTAAPGNGGAPRSPWRFIPSLDLTETYSDNANFGTKGTERSDLVTLISPGLRIARYGPRLVFNASYLPQLIYYARGTNGSYIRNYLDLAADATLVQNFLFFDARASISQQNISPFGTQSAGTVNNSSNSIETRTYALGPTVRSRFGNDLSYVAGYQFSGTTADSNAYNANHTSTVYAQFESGTSSRNLGYTASLNRSDQEYGDAGKVTTQSVSNGLNYVLTPTLRVRANIGYDKNEYPTIDDGGSDSGRDLKGMSYSFGGDWSPSQHTNLSALVGHRYFGPTANVSFSRTTPRTAISIIYTRDQRTSSGAGLLPVPNQNYVLADALLRATFPDPVQRQLVVQQFLAQQGLPTSPYAVGSFVSNQIYLEKSLQGSIAFIGLRNTVTFTGFRTESQSLSSLTTGLDVFDQAQKIRQTGYAAAWNYKLGPRTNVTASYSLTKSVAVIGLGDSRTRTLTATVTRQLSPRTSASVSVRNTVQDARDSNVVGNYYNGNYRENQIVGALHLTF